MEFRNFSSFFSQNFLKFRKIKNIFPFSAVRYIWRVCCRILRQRSQHLRGGRQNDEARMEFEHSSGSGSVSYIFSIFFWKIWIFFRVLNIICSSITFQKNFETKKFFSKNLKFQNSHLPDHQPGSWRSRRFVRRWPRESLLRGGSCWKRRSQARNGCDVRNGRPGPEIRRWGGHRTLHWCYLLGSAKEGVKNLHFFLNFCLFLMFAVIFCRYSTKILIYLFFRWIKIYCNWKISFFRNLWLKLHFSI